LDIHKKQQNEIDNRRLRNLLREIQIQNGNKAAEKDKEKKRDVLLDNKVVKP